MPEKKDNWTVEIDQTFSSISDHGSDEETARKHFDSLARNDHQSSGTSSSKLRLKNNDKVIKAKDYPENKDL